MEDRQLGGRQPVAALEGVQADPLLGHRVAHRVEVEHLHLCRWLGWATVASRRPCERSRVYVRYRSAADTNGIRKRHRMASELGRAGLEPGRPVQMSAAPFRPLPAA